MRRRTLPQVSVIIPALNAAAMLPAALESLGAEAVDWQAVVVDGGSTDDTIKIARDWPGVDVIAAPGSSIYGALNIGIATAAAPAIVLLNADDILVSGALSALLDTLAAVPAADVARGRPQFFGDSPEAAAHAVAIERKADRPLSLRLITRGPASINTMLFRRALFDRIGTFDERWRFAADREWLLRMWLAEVRWIELAKPVYRYRVHLGSSTLDRQERKNYTKIREEHLEIIHRFNMSTSDNLTLRAELRLWHATEVALIASQAARQRDWPKLVGALGRGFRRDPLWPIRLAGDALGCDGTKRRLAAS